MKSFMSGVNRLRRLLMTGITAGIGTPNARLKAECATVRRILISRPNGRLGNQLLVTPLLQEVESLFPNAQVDVFVRGGVSRILLCNYACVDRIIMLPSRPFKALIAYLGVWFRLRSHYYDLAINTTAGSSSGRLSVKYAHAKEKIYSLQDAATEACRSDYKHIAKKPIYNLRSCLGIDPKADRTPIPMLDLHLSADEKTAGRLKLSELVGNDRPTICIYTFATGQKCYSKEWWGRFYARLQDFAGTHYNILEVLPKENVSQIDFHATHYYSCDLREIAAVISSSVVFIGADSGMMHLAVASGVPVIGFFSVTDDQVYCPYGNGSVAVRTEEATLDDVMAHVCRLVP